MLFFKSRQKKEEIQDKIDDIDMAIYRRRCDLQTAKENDDKEAFEQAKQKMMELEKKRKKLQKKLS